MAALWIAFLTGLTTGGLSCLAVQGGLLASSLAQQIEHDLQARPIKGKGKKGRQDPPTQAKTQPALPIVLFLAAKLVAYTFLGFLLGSLGAIFQLTPLMRAILLLGIGIFMIGNALRMLNVHPIFRYFIFEPPSFLTRYIRQTAKNGSAYATPVFLGAMTVLIPCGVTQAMMAVALATGNPFQGAATMFAFILGTSPVFFIVAYLATKLGQRMEAWFMRFVAITLLILGLVSIDSGLNLAGSPISVTKAVRSMFTTPQAVETSPIVASNNLTLAARNDGYSPEILHAKANEPILLNLVTNKTYSCARSFVIPSLGVEKLLPASGIVPVDIPPQKAGTVMQFTCSMGMFTGQIVFDQ